jgi:hypothetical protein
MHMGDKGLTGQCGWQSDKDSSGMHWVGPWCTGWDDCYTSHKLRVYHQQGWNMSVEPGGMILVGGNKWKS